MELTIANGRMIYKNVLKIPYPGIKEDKEENILCSDEQNIGAHSRTKCSKNICSVGGCTM